MTAGRGLGSTRPAAAVHASSDGPPKARIAFRVGVVGHRPDRLPGDGDGQHTIRERLSGVFEAVREAVEAFRGEADAALYDPGPAVLRALSPLAEGADRDFAEAAVEHGFSLCCPMPFLLEDYERDFAGGAAQEGGSLERFRAILAAARSGPGLDIFELDGSREDEAAAYGAAGRLVLNQSDLLVVVWDGGRARGGGGTVETLREAIGYHVPVLWLDARPPYGWVMLRDPEQLACLGDDGPCTDRSADIAGLAAAVRELVLEELRVPRAEAGSVEEGPDHARAYFQERRPRFNLFFQWKLFRDLLSSGALSIPRLGVPPFVDQVRRAWPVDPGEAAPGCAPSPVLARVNGDLRAHYAWADKRADLYADAHRSMNIITSLFASLAVFLALLPMATNWAESNRVLERWCVVLELFTLLNIVMLLLLGRRRRWHERWLEYRVLAELVRQLRLLAPLGGGRPLPRSRAHLVAYGDPARSWMYWQIRAIARMVGIPSVRVTPDYVAACVEDLFDVVDGPEHGQLRFHVASHHRAERIHENLHLATMLLFWGTCVAVITHMLTGVVAPVFDRTTFAGVERWLLLIAAVAPSVGAALANINNQGEFARLAKRSRAMIEGFSSFRGQLLALRARAVAGQPGPAISEVTSLARRMTEMMVDENVDWRVVVVDLPHAGG